MTTFECLKCKQNFEYDDWNFSVHIKCPNCNKEYDLVCDQFEPDYEHIHYLEQRDLGDI